MFRTPVLKVFKGKETIEFFTEKEFKHWEETEGKNIKGWTFKYYKGLGTSTSKEFAEYIDNIEDYLYSIELQDKEDKEAIELAFKSTLADERKDWLATPAMSFEDFVQ